MTESTARADRPSLAAFAHYLLSQQTTITEQWLLIVRRDTQIETADRMPTPELVDHLPRLLQELCEFLRTRDVGNLTGGTRRDASHHGELRWRDGYKIDELVRELEVFRQLVSASAFHFRDIDAAFKGGLEVSASALIQQFFAEVNVQSVKQFVNEQQNVTRSCVQDLADVQQQLGRVQTELAQARDAQQRAASVVAYELRRFLERHARSPGAAEASPAMATLVEQLSEYVELTETQEPLTDGSFDPRALFSEIVATCKPLADAKGLRLLTECLTAPETVRGERLRIKKIAQLLLEDAIDHTPSGRVLFAFSFPDSEHWTIKVTDTGPALDAQDSAQLLQGGAPAGDLSHARGMILSMVKDLAKALHASLQTTTQVGVGTRTEVSFPRLTG